MSFEQNWEIDFFIYAHEIVKSDYCATVETNKNSKGTWSLHISDTIVFTLCPLHEYGLIW